MDDWGGEKSKKEDPISNKKVKTVSLYSSLSPIPLFLMNPFLRNWGVWSSPSPWKLLHQASQCQRAGRAKVEHFRDLFRDSEFERESLDLEFVLKTILYWF